MTLSNHTRSYLNSMISHIKIMHLLIHDLKEYRLISKLLISKNQLELQIFYNDQTKKLKKRQWIKEESIEIHDLKT